LFLVLLGSYVPASHADLYRCKTPEGGTLLTDKACADNPMAAHDAAPPVSSGTPAHVTPAAPTTAPPKPKPAVRAATAPVARNAPPRVPPAAAKTPMAPRPAPPPPALDDDAQSELANFAYLRAMGEQCSLPVEHTQVLRFLDMLAADRLAGQGVHLTPEQTRGLATAGRERAERDVAGARQNACENADRKLVELGQTRVQFQVRSPQHGG
jgi:hypothetical protein